MIIRVEPKDWSMYSVLLYFDARSPDAEDEGIKNYLLENGLEPKRQTRQQSGNVEVDVMSFGGCYLGPRHMNALADIQRNVVEKELLAEAIPALLKDASDSETSKIVSNLNADTVQKIIEELAEKYRDPSSFELDGEGHLKVSLNAADVQKSFNEIAALTSHD